MKTTRRVICWKCEDVFRVDVEDLGRARVTVVREIGGDAKTQKPKQKFIVKCPNCAAENEVRV